MDSREYNEPEEFASDIRLMLTTCYKYCLMGSELLSMARKLGVNTIIY